jgi:hypothetical protein
MQKKKSNYKETDVRVCKVCKKELPITKFPTAGTNKGVNYKRHKCNKCYVKNKTHRRIAQRKWLNEYKETLACIKCGYSKNTHPNFTTGALQFHHAKDDKEFMISNGAARGMAKEKILNEINKCIVLCCRCHAEIHKYGQKI